MIRFLPAILVVTALSTSPTAGSNEGYWQPGGYEGRIGSPYYYSLPADAAGRFSAPVMPSARFSPSVTSDCACNAWGRYRDARGLHTTYYLNSSYDYRWRTAAFDPYTWHFGPGYYRHSEHGHYRFPYYSYRRPWYYPGQPVFNRDTNFAW